MMKKTVFIFALAMMAMTAMATKVVSPNGKIVVTAKGRGLEVSYNRQAVLQIPFVGFDEADGSGSAQKGTKALKLKFQRRIIDDYRMLAGKRLHCTNTANEYQAVLSKQVQMVLRLYNDGIALRYEAAETMNGSQGRNGNLQPQAELTTFRIPEGTKRWMQQWSDGYEGFFPLMTTAKQKPVAAQWQKSVDADGYNNRWAYPALVELQTGVFALISEADIERHESASCLYSGMPVPGPFVEGKEGAPACELFRVVPDKTNGPLTGRWHTPWRTVIMGSLGDVVESTLITDVSRPSLIADTSWIHPGVGSWVYWAYNHGSNDFNIIRKYVDFAAALRLPYVLIDAEWDEMKDGKSIVDAVNYAKEKGVRPLIWYNSSVGWIDGAPGPKFRLNKPEDREKEFAWCEQIGVAGVKIDFFSGDTQLNMDYCQDLMECAARHHLLVNFHGATIPRGWQRTYPNLLSTEGVYGAEWYNNVPTFTKRAARHNATLPFTRNVIGPMDYTPCAFSDSQHPHITTHGHELALTVLYESGLQHLADRPESFLAQPQEVKQFLTELPAAWDETRLVSGYPGESAVIARRSGSTWFVAGINGLDEEQTLDLSPLKTIVRQPTALLFADGRPWNIGKVSIPSSIVCQPRGGFVMVIKN